MDCYKIIVDEAYCGGCAIIAAKSEKEAIDTFCLNEYNKFVYGFYNCKCNLIPGLHYDTETSKIVIDSIHIE